MYVCVCIAEEETIQLMSTKFATIVPTRLLCTQSPAYNGQEGQLYRRRGEQGRRPSRVLGIRALFSILIPLTIMR